MLKTRIITAICLLAGLLPALFFLPTQGWALLMAGVVGVAAWEWGALCRMTAPLRLAYGLIFGSLCCLVGLLFPAYLSLHGPDQGGMTPTVWIHGAATLFWFLCVPLWLRTKWQPGLVAGMALGVVVIFPAWLAMVQLRAESPWVLLALLAVPWVADIAAYFSGRRFGKKKLAPSISPGKTWEGAYGAALGVVVYGALMAWSFEVPKIPPAFWVPLLLAITAVSVVGDLIESLLKRQAGIKDSSNVLPGHGGVMDRIDSLTSTLPCFALIWILFA